ncbi:MAG: DUF1572 family protein [Planctomycetota bacterium]
MDLLASIRTEYARHRRMAELAVAQVSDAAFDQCLDPHGNSIAVVMAHLAGNLRSRFTDFLTTDGEKPWRDRDREFEAPGVTRAELMARWREAWTVLDRALADVAAAGPDALGRTVTIRDQPLTVGDALLRSVAHLAYHVGQIALMARAFAGDRWQTLSIPRGGSAAYAANPTREKSPDGR